MTAMLSRIENFSNTELAKIFNAITGQTVSRFTNRQVGIERVQKALLASSTDLDDALELAGMLNRDEAPDEAASEAQDTSEAQEADAPAGPVEFATVNGTLASAAEDEVIERRVDKYGFVHRVGKTRGRKPDATVSSATAPEGGEARKAAKPARAKAERGPSKLDMVLNLMRRDEGATVPEIMEATGWLPHTTRAYLSKGGAAGKAATIMSEKVERDGKKVTVYRVR